jgi:hypothetical protein
MFLENKANRDKKKGWVEVIAGSMFSGKTEELLRRLRRARIAGQNVEIFKPIIDNRYSESEVVSHDKNSIASTAVDSSGNILLLSANVDVWALTKRSFSTTAWLMFAKHWPTKAYAWWWPVSTWTSRANHLALCPTSWPLLNTSPKYMPFA